jgi:hypothetical protein
MWKGTARKTWYNPLAGEFEAAFVAACRSDPSKASVRLLEPMLRPPEFQLRANRSGLRRRRPLGSGLRLSAIGGRVDAVLGVPFGKGLALEHEFFAEARIKIAE